MVKLNESDYKWNFIWTKSFKKGYNDYPYKKLFNQILETLNKNPYNNPNIKKLQGEWIGYYRYRKGDFRMIYQINEINKEIILIGFASRGSIY